MTEAVVESVKAGPDGKYACPECTANYPERTVSYTTAAGLSSHRFHRHGVGGSTPGFGGNPPVKANFEKTDRGTYVCPECKRDDFVYPMLVGRHRFKDHGIPSQLPHKFKPKGKRVLAPKQVVAQVPKHAPVEKQEAYAPSFVVAYLFGRVEFEIESYAKQNGLAAGSLKNDIGDLLKQSA